MRKAIFLRRVMVAALVVLFFGIPSTPIDVAEAGTIDSFSTGNSSETYVFNAPGNQDTIYLKVPVDGTVISATMDVTGQVLSGYEHPTAVRVFVGNIAQGTEVYRFQGPAYGSMGHQYMFNDGKVTKTIIFEESGTDDTMRVRLPRGADVLNASIRFKGELQDAGWASAIPISEQVGSNFVPVDTGYMSCPQLVDVDNDGDLDLLSGGYIWGWPREYIFYWENTGNSTNPVWTDESSTFRNVVSNLNNPYYTAPRLVDLDKDGDRDFVLGMYDGSISLYWNEGTDASPSWTYNGTGVNSVFYGIGSGTTQYYARPDFADMDNDGDLDMAYGEYAYQGGTSNVGIDSWRNDYNNGVWSWTTYNFFGGITTDQYSSPHLVDWDGDGDNDLFVGFYNGTIAYYENTGTKANPKWTQDTKVTANIDIGTLANPWTGDLDGDGDLDLVVGGYSGEIYYYENLRSFPTNPKLDIGKDGDTEVSFSGTFDKTSTVSGFHDELESHIKTNGRPSYTDHWGNVFDDIVLSLSSESPGGMVVDQVHITYSYTKTTRDFATILAKYISDNKDKADDEGNLLVPIVVTSTTKGKVMLSNVKVVIDVPPKWAKIPSTYSVPEDTKDLQLIDLLDYVLDDFDSQANLKLSVVQLDQVGIVEVTLQDGHFVGADSETGTANDNWYGNVRVVVSATDSRGQTTKSNEFTIEVTPVNDAPELKGAPPATVNEDSTLKYQIEAFDVDKDPLKYEIEGMPEGMVLSDTGLVTWTPTNDDVGTYTMTISVTDPSSERVDMTWILEVINVNDAPVISGLPTEMDVTEGIADYIDIAKGISDVDNALSELTIEMVAGSPYVDMDANLIITILFPKESGFDDDHIDIMVIDPAGAMATWGIDLRVIHVDKLDLIGIPDQQAVEEDSWTLDIKPHLYNVETYNKLVITTSSNYITVSGTKLNLYYPKDALPNLQEIVRVTAKQNDEVATDEFTVSLLRLGHDLTLTIIPDQDVLEDEVSTLDITPYIKNAPEIDKVKVTIKATEHVSVNGRVITFDYPQYYDPESEVVTVIIGYLEFGSSREFTVNIHDTEDDFYLAEIPEVTVTETIPETFNIKQYIMNAYDIDRIDAWTDSPYADVNRFDIQMTYPDGFTGGEKVRDDLIRVTVSDGLHEYTRAVTIHVNRLGKELQMTGIGDRTVYYGTDLVIDVEPYLYNVDEIDDVAVSVAPSSYMVEQDGFRFTFNYPASLSLTLQQVTFTATEGTDIAAETIIIYVEHAPKVFAFAPIGSITAVEDESYVLDVEPYLVNMAPGIDYTIGIHSDHATVEGFVVTFLYETEVTMDEIVRINVTGANEDFAEQDIYVHVKTVNDPPVLAEPIATDLQVKEGEEAVTIDLTKVFTDIDTDTLNYSCDEEVIRIDWENGVATIVFVTNTARPDDLEGVVIYAFDPDDPDSMVGSNEFNVTFYLEDEEPPGPGPVGPSSGVQEPDGGSGWIIIALLVIVGVAGIGWMYYRKRRPAELG